MFFWSVFSRIWAEYDDLRIKSPYSVQIRENTDQKKLCIWTLFKVSVGRMQKVFKRSEIFSNIFQKY